MSKQKNFVKFFVVAAIVLGWLQSGARLYPQDPKSLGFKKMLLIEIKNPTDTNLENFPVTLNIKQIQAKAPDFNSYNFALFERVAGEYRLIQTQNDDYNGDRYHEEIFFLKTLPAASTTTLFCYYSPKGSLQLMIAPKVFIRQGKKPDKPDLYWESLILASRFNAGRIIPYGKFGPGLVLQKASLDDEKPLGWGARLLDASDSGGAGGLCLWDGQKKISLNPPHILESDIKTAIVSMGPLRVIARIDYAGLKTSQGEAGLSSYLTMHADSFWTKFEVKPEKLNKIAFIGTSLIKLAEESWQLEKDKGYLAAWGKSSTGAGEIGLAIIFKPEDFLGLEESGSARFLKFKTASAKALEFWAATSWSRGITAPSSPAVKSWLSRVEALSQILRAHIVISYKLSE